jgi:hypothetical protein
MANGTWWIVAIIIVASLAINGCDNVQSSPKIIVADGETIMACKDMVWVDTEGGGLLGGVSTFKIRYTDIDGLTHVLRGVKTVQVSDIPKLVDAPLPSNPSLIDKDGKPLVEGQSYTWEDGTRGRYRNGKLEPIKIPNTVCNVGIQ